MAKNSRRRNEDERRLNHLYSRKFKKYGRCIYCGDTEQCLDHVYPISKLGMNDLSKINRPLFKIFFQGLNLVPSCFECNALAEDRSFVSIREKRKFIQSKIKKKYKKILNLPEWSEEEIKELGPNLRKSVKFSINQKESVKRRIMWPFFKL